MNAPIVFLATRHVLAIHARVSEDFGGSRDLREHGLLESAVNMPRASFGGQYLHAGIPAMAAAYLFHLCMNHPFVDGNKRTALVSAEVFLELNGRRLSASNRELERITLGVAAGSVSKETLTAFFRKRVKRS